MAHRCRLSKSRSLTKVGQKRKLKSTTHSPLKTIPIRQHLKKRDDGKGVQVPIRLQLDFREGKRAYCRLCKEHVESSGQGNQSIRQRNNEDKILNNNFEGHEEYAYKVHLEIGWRNYPSTSSSSSS